jgi:hypothetical protein
MPVGRNASAQLCSSGTRRPCYNIIIERRSVAGWSASIDAMPRRIPASSDRAEE